MSFPLRPRALKRLTRSATGPFGKGADSPGTSPSTIAIPESSSSLVPPWQPSPGSPLCRGHPSGVVSSEDYSSQVESATQLGSESSSYSSPTRKPVAPLVPIGTNLDGKVQYGFSDDIIAEDKYYDDRRKYDDKQAQQRKLVTLMPFSRIPSIHERYSSNEKEMILCAAKSIISLSAYHESKQIGQYTGIVIEWDEINKTAIVLTPSLIVCTKKPFNHWSEREYAPGANVVAHLLNGTNIDAQLVYFSQHYDIAIFQVAGVSGFQSLILSSNLDSSEYLFLLARDTKNDLICRKVNVMCLDPCDHQHNHYQFVTGKIIKCCTGGPLLSLDGKIKGVVFYTHPFTSFIPSALVIACLSLWRNHGRIARPHLGLKLRTIRFLDISHIELLSRTLGISTGLIIDEVSANCAAEKFGIRVGDVLLSCQGKDVSTTTELETTLLGVFEKHCEESIDQSSKVDITVSVLHVRKKITRTITLNVELSEGIEVFHAANMDIDDLADKLHHSKLDKHQEHTDGEDQTGKKLEVTSAGNKHVPRKRKARKKHDKAAAVVSQ